MSCFELNIATTEVSGSLVLFSGEGVYWLAEFASARASALKSSLTYLATLLENKVAILISLSGTAEAPPRQSHFEILQ